MVDLLTIMESHKTIDNKTFYKTADICQLLIICKEGEDFDDEEDTNSPVSVKWEVITEEELSNKFGSRLAKSI